MTKGALTVVGSGIRSIVQLTLEAITCIEKADKVFYCVSDPGTEGFIKGKNQNTTDLYKYYSNDKPRADTYIQMAEVMLQDVRAGLNVVGVFYGHAGNFVWPSRRALAIAKSEGYEAKMLPGISAEDCLYADLLVDPSYPGAQTVEATDLIIRNRPLETSSHVIIYQVGVLGQFDFNFDGIKNNKFEVLVRRLLDEYGPDHPVVNYKAPISPFVQATIQRYTVADLWKEDVQKSIDTISTFYVPPKDLLPISNPEMITENISEISDLIDPPVWADPLRKSSNFYGPRETKAVADLQSYVAPNEYRPYAASPAMQAAMEKISLDIGEHAAYVKLSDPFGAVHGRHDHGLHEHEVKALVTGNQNEIFSSMREGHTEGDVRIPITSTIIRV